MPDNKQFIPLMHRLADLAASKTLPLFRTPHNIEDKTARDYFDPVTLADKQAEEIIRETLRQELPDHGILGEEFPTHLPDADFQWVIDPIDGTRSFIMGSPLWGTLIGLNYKGNPVLGLIDQPFTGERFWTDGETCYLRCLNSPDKEIKTRQNIPLGQAILTTTCPDFFPSKQDLSAFMAVKEKAQMTRYGGDCYQYALLLMGFTDVVIEAGLEPYDILPIVPLILAAGGVITNWQGDEDLSDGRIVAAGSAALHKEVLGVLGKTV